MRKLTHETIEAALWPLDSTAAPRQLSEGYLIPELDDEGGVFDISLVDPELIWNVD